jgi:hypothetical protein
VFFLFDFDPPPSWSTFLAALKGNGANSPGIFALAACRAVLYICRRHFPNPRTASGAKNRVEIAPCKKSALALPTGSLFERKNSVPTWVATVEIRLLPCQSIRRIGAFYYGRVSLWPYPVTIFLLSPAPASAYIR